MPAEIERWSDQFKPKTASAATAVAALRTVHAARQYDKELLPPSAFEAIFEKKPRGKSGQKGELSGSISSFSSSHAEIQIMSCSSPMNCTDA